MHEYNYDVTAVPVPSIVAGKFILSYFKCAICKQEITHGGYTLGYGSKYDGMKVCENCLISIMDSIIGRIDLYASS